MAAAITELRNSIRDTIADEFAPEGLTVVDDKMHDALGTETAMGAVYPEGERQGEKGLVRYVVTAQVFMRWDPQIDPAQRVDPADIEAWAWRLQRRMKADSSVNSPNLDYYIVTEVLYPDDPTGNKTRFTLTAVGFGDSPSLGETTA